ncbi:MAG: MauE/DoxX family redox-associated membrane protein [Candidatus Eisenbacteria bacterium]
MGFGETRSRALAAIGAPIRVYLGGVFVLASLHKIQEPYEFALSVATYQILPLPAVNLFAIFLPWLELITGGLLIAGVWTRANALLILGMLIMFTTSLGIALARGYQMSCGCFASQEAAEQIGTGTLVRDILWVLLAAYVLLLDDGRFGLDRFLRRRTSHA